MSAIDSAIIKALVEHMNAGATSSNEIFEEIEITGQITNDGSVKLSYTGDLEYGFLLKLKRSDTGIIETFICASFENLMRSTGQRKIYEFTNGRTPIVFTYESGVYSFKLPVGYEQPDNRITGVYKHKNTNVLDTTSTGSVLRILFSGMHMLLDELMKYVDTKADKTYDDE